MLYAEDNLRDSHESTRKEASVGRSAWRKRRVVTPTSSPSMQLLLHDVSAGSLPHASCRQAHGRSPEVALSVLRPNFPIHQGSHQSSQERTSHNGQSLSPLSIKIPTIYLSNLLKITGAHVSNLLEGLYECQQLQVSRAAARKSSCGQEKVPPQSRHRHWTLHLRILRKGFQEPIVPRLPHQGETRFLRNEKDKFD